MTWADYVLIAVKALSVHKLRSLLTVLSITIGAFAIVLMSSLAEGGLETLTAALQELGGARLILVAPKVPERAERKQAMYVPGFWERDRARLFEGVPHVAETAMLASLGTRDVTTDEGKQDRTDLVAGDSRFFSAFRMHIGRGRAFSEEENLRRARVCVVGHKLAERLWSGDPIGRRLTIGALRCRVIGVLKDNDRIGIGFGFSWVDLLIAPLESVADLEPKTRTETIISAKTDDARHNDPVKRILNARMMERHHGVDDFTIYDFSTLMTKFKLIFAIMEALVGLIAGVALMIGGVGVMNMMLVSVTERTREIGIRKALGAAPWDISAQFLCEATLLSSFGGLLGTLGGALVAAVASVVLKGFVPSWVGSVSTPAVIAAMVVALGVGVGFGWIPARRAGQLDPIEAMRR